MGASSRLTATIDDSTQSGVLIPFSSGVDDYGVAWTMSDLDGWDSPNLDEASEAKSGQDGLWDSETFYAGRTITLVGKLVAPTYELREASEYRLRQVVTRNRLVPFQVNETTPKLARCRRSGRLMVRPLTETISEFSISMLATDPRKYGTVPVTAAISAAGAAAGLAPPWTPPVLLPALADGSSQATLTNLGIYDSPPRITITGPGSSIALVNFSTSQQLAFDLTLGVSDFLLIDVAAGTALLNGTSPRAPSPGSTVIARFLAAPGDNLYRIFGAPVGGVSPSATVTFYSAWI